MNESIKMFDFIEYVKENKTSQYEYKNYKPNFKNRRVVRRLVKAAGFIAGEVSFTKPKQISATRIRKYLGMNSLGWWLHKTLLICTNESYAVGDRTKMYISNKEGLAKIMAVINGTDYTEPEIVLSANNILELESKKFEDIEVYQKIKSIEEKTSQEKLLALRHNAEKAYTYFKDLSDGKLSYYDKSSRYWHPLQNFSKEAKNLYFKAFGYYHTYDIEACAPTLLLQHAQKLGFDEYPFSIKEYINNRTEVRQMISDSTGIPVRLIKILVNSMFSGAKVGKNWRFSTYQLLEYNSSWVTALQNLEFFQTLKSDISNMWKVIIAHDDTISKRRVRKLDKNGTNRLVPVSSKIKWKIYFSLERIVLDSVIDYSELNKISLFREHDGWSTDQFIDPIELQDQIESRTGYKVRLDYVNLNTDPVQVTDSLDGIIEQLALVQLQESVLENLSKSGTIKTSPRQILPIPDYYSHDGYIIILKTEAKNEKTDSRSEISQFDSNSLIEEY